MRAIASPLLPTALLLFLLSLAAGSPVHAQQGTGALVVAVHAEETGRPLAGAQVLVQGIGIGGATDAAGITRLPDLPPGALKVEVRYLGYATERSQVVLTPGRVTVLSFSLAPQPIALPEVKVRARRSILVTNGFFSRRGSGFGTFLTRDEIQSMRPRFLSDVLRRVAGVSLTPGVAGTSRASFRGSKVLGNCPIQYYVDGTMTAMFNIDEVLPDDVEGLEIYRGAATIPPLFNKGTAMCGVVVIWTRVQ